MANYYIINTYFIYLPLIYIFIFLFPHFFCFILDQLGLGFGKKQILLTACFSDPFLQLQG